MATPANELLEPAEGEPLRPPRWSRSKQYNDDSYNLYRRILGTYVSIYSIYIIGVAVTLVVAEDILTVLYVFFPLIFDVLLFVWVAWLGRMIRLRPYRQQWPRLMGRGRPRLDEEGSWQLYSLKRTDPKAWELSEGPETSVTLKVQTLPFPRKSSPMVEKLTLFAGIKIAGINAEKLKERKQLLNSFKITVIVRKETQTPPIELKQDKDDEALYLSEGISGAEVTLGQELELELPSKQVKVLEDILLKVLVKPSAEV